MQKKLTNHTKIYHADSLYKEEIGYLQLIKNSNYYEIEYWLDEEYHKQGIMSIQLPIYLAELEKEGISCIFANVEKGNIASKKLLKKNGFVKISEVPKDFENYMKKNKNNC